MKRWVVSAAICAAGLWSTEPVRAFCGFYVAKADTKLFNRASQVVLVRDGDRTVLTMANDFRGDPKEFAIVIPVPTFIERGQIHVADSALVEHLDAYSAPRLVEYFDENPCRRYLEERLMSKTAPMSAADRADAKRERGLGITVEAQYTVGEYDIVILSATESNGLETWLRENGYRIPAGASNVLTSYIRQHMRFFVAKTNLKEQARLGYAHLRPIQVAYESPKFMLPIRLGMVNADGPQELFVFALTRKGRIETTNYRTVKLPSAMEVPLFVKEEFGPFYRALFSEQVRKEAMQTVFVEYAWDMAWCDPCAADPLTAQELRGLGIFWLDEPEPLPAGQQRRRPGRIVPALQAADVFLTRLHLRYDNAHFPEDLVFQETADRENFQSRYVLRHPWTGTDACSAADEYRSDLHNRQDRVAQTLSSLTGWSVTDIRRKMNIPARGPNNLDGPKWWQRIWKDVGGG